LSDDKPGINYSPLTILIKLFIFILNPFLTLDHTFMIKRVLHSICTLFFLIFSLSIQAQWDNPRVYYRFNETSGSLVADSSGNNFDCYANCNDCWETEGKFNGALHFQGAQKMDLPAKDIALTNEKGTVAFWVLLPESSISSINCIWWAGEYGGDMFGPQNEMHINSEFTEENIWSGGEIAFVIRDSLADESYFLFSDPWKGENPATPPSENAITITDGVWHHVACTWESGGTVALYIDSQAIWDTTAYNPNSWKCNIMTIGAANERTNRRLNGYLDEFRMYDEALEAADIEAIYNYIPEVVPDNIESLKKPSIASLNFYPNPASNYISFVNSLGIKTIEIYSLTGEKLVVLNNCIKNAIVEINIDQLSPGFYFIRAYDHDTLIAVGKFSKE
jgi:hypothetical protein